MSTTGGRRLEPSEGVEASEGVERAELLETPDGLETAEGRENSSRTASTRAQPGPGLQRRADRPWLARAACTWCWSSAWARKSAP